MKTLLNNLGLSYLWNSQSISQLQLNMVIQFMPQKIHLANWRHSEQSINILNLRITSLQLIWTYKHRIALSRLRCSVRRLMIEEGRFRGIERNLRIYPLCPMHIIEDEYHLL